MITIYYCNYIGQDYKTMILANLALAWSVYYNCEIRCKLICTLLLYYDHKSFIVQTTNYYAVNLYVP